MLLRLLALSAVLVSSTVSAGRHVKKEKPKVSIAKFLARGCSVKSCTP